MKGLHLAASPLQDFTRVSSEPPTTASPPAADFPSPDPRPGLPGFRFFLPLLLILAVVAGATALLAGGSNSPKLPGNATSAGNPTYQGSLLSPIRAAPPLATLHSYQGRPINLTSYRGKAVFLTFIYTHCPDVCPLIASHLHTAVAQMGAHARDVQLIAVSVDPTGDTRGAVAAFLHQHELTGEMQYLIGTGHQLAPVWSAWYVGSQRDIGKPDLVSHSALVYGISASGKLTTIYAANFAPSEIVHDVAPLLAH